MKKIRCAGRCVLLPASAPPDRGTVSPSRYARESSSSVCVGTDIAWPSPLALRDWAVSPALIL